MRDHLLHHLLENSAKEFPDKAAVVFKGKSLTYADLDKQSDEVAHTLTRLGVTRGDRVGIMLTKSIEAIVSIFGILKSGAIYVPIDPTAPVHRATYIIDHCGIECLFTSPQQLLTLLSASENAIHISTAILVGKKCDELNQKNVNLKYFSSDNASITDENEFDAPELSDTSPAYILHTSGSTGNPKGVAISHLNALTYVKTAAEFFAATPTDRFCNHAPLHFDLSVFDIFVAVKCGATIVLIPELYSTFPVKLAECIAQERITVWNSVSSVLKMLADKGGLHLHKLDSVRIVHFSGDIMTAKYLRVLTKHMGNAAFFNIYGQTEANSSTFYPIREISENDSWRIPIGKPFPNFEVFALNDDREVIRHTDEEGELYVSSSTVALGYWGDEKNTGDKFVPDPRYPSLRKIVYKTGDLVRLDENGDFVFSGRKDHMVKSRGYRIELEEIEIVLSSHPEIMAAVAIPVPDDLIGNRIVSFVVTVNGRTVSREELLGYCAGRLPKYMMPEAIEFRDSLPMTSSGKIDRKKLGPVLDAAAVSDVHASDTAACAGTKH
jgi:L-proline---[L-prolyl-carrier protein] ligase